MKLKVLIFVIALVLSGNFSDANEHKKDSNSNKLINDNECDNQLELFSESISKRELWAITSKLTRDYEQWKQHFFNYAVFDLWGKIQSGYLQGNHFDFGHFTECVKYRHRTSNDTLQGQYCLVNFSGIQKTTLVSENKSSEFKWSEL